MKKLLSFILFSLFSINLLHAVDMTILQNLDIHGDIRTKWKSIWDVKDDHSFKAEANLKCDYMTQDARFSFNMKAATANSDESIFCVDKALLGYQILEKFVQDYEMGLGVEVGRNKMESMFDSKMQYDSYFNGVHLIYTLREPDFVDFTVHGGINIVDCRTDHYGWVVEGISKHLVGIPIILKYSFADWNAPKEDGKYDENYHFAISQITGIYEFEQGSIYAAYLHNHHAKTNKNGFYAGITAGKIRKINDFLFDVNFQFSQSSLLSPIDNKSLTRGIQVKVIYALAERLNVEAKFSRNDKDDINKLEFQAIYAF